MKAGQGRRAASRGGAAWIVALLSACVSGEAGRGAIADGAVRVGDTLRTFELYAPATARRGNPVPLLLAFHGSGSTGRGMRRESGLDSVAARDGFLVVYPDAPAGNWAEDCGCNIADRLGVNDTGFVRALVDTVSAHFRVDPDRVAAVGFSQGGLFVHRLACQMADVVSAVASISAPMSGVLAVRCRPSRPVSVMVALGTLDPVYLYEGGGSGDRVTLGARAAVRVWRALDGCAPEPAVTELPNRAADGTTVLEERWSDCEDDAAVALYTVDGGRHGWDLSRDAATAEIVAAFLFPGAAR